MDNKIIKLIQNLCANYSLVGPTDVRNWCWPRDKICRFFNKEPERCGYFERAVMPTDEEVKQEYIKYFTGEVVGINRRKCECGNMFIPKSNRQEMCENCYKSYRRQKNQEYKQKQRAKK